MARCIMSFYFHLLIKRKRSHRGSILRKRTDSYLPAVFPLFHEASDVSGAPQLHRWEDSWICLSVFGRVQGVSCLLQVVQFVFSVVSLIPTHTSLPIWQWIVLIVSVSLGKRLARNLDPGEVAPLLLRMAADIIGIPIAIDEASTIFFFVANHSGALCCR